MEIARSNRPVYTYAGKHYFTLYGACYRKAKDLAMEMYFTPKSKWDDRDWKTKIKPEYQADLIIGGVHEPEHLDSYLWQSIKRRFAKELLKQEKQQPSRDT